MLTLADEKELKDTKKKRSKPRKTVLKPKIRIKNLVNYKYTLNIHCPNERDGLYIDSSDEEDKVREQTPLSDFNDLQHNLLKLLQNQQLINKM